MAPSNLYNSEGLTYAVAAVDTYITGGQWHMISSPLWFQQISTFYLDGSPEVYITRYDESTNTYVYISDLNFTMEDMTGYMIWVDGEDQLFTYWGFFNEGYYEKANLSRSAPGAGSGWHMVGNPYPCSIDWDMEWAWTRTDINPTFYVYNDGVWASYNSSSGGVNGGDRLIAPGQGFFVNVTDGATTGTLGVDPGAQTNEPGYLYKTIQELEGLKLQASGNGRTDEIILRFPLEATSSFDSQLDAYKLFSSNALVPQIYTKSDVDYAINSMPQVDHLPLYFECGIGGSYDITMLESDVGDVWLEDTKEDVMHKLSEGSYSFSHEVMNGPDRFILHFQTLDTRETKLPQSLQVYATEQAIHMKSTGSVQGDYWIYTISGQQVLTGSFNSSTSLLGHIEQPGNYIVKLMTSGQLSSYKVNIP